MYYEVYIDVVFATNLLMDYILLRLVGTIFRCRKNRKRTLLAAVLGALFSCLLLYFPADVHLPAVILLHGGCAFGMVMLGCGLKKGGLLIKAMVTLYLAAFLCGGFLEAVTAGSEITVKLFFVFAACVYLGLMALGYLTDSLRVRMRNMYPVTLSYQGKKQPFCGFYDSGNLLMDGTSPVSIISQEVLGKILPRDTAEKLKNLREKPGEFENTEIAGLHPHFLTYKTIGGNGVTLAVTLEKLCIQTPEEMVEIDRPVLALLSEPSALGKEYEVLLNFRLLQ